MKTIELTRGQVAIVDDEVYEALMKHGWKWHLSGDGYAATKIIYRDFDNKRHTTTVLMHRWILESFYNIRVGGCQVDHRNELKTDNQLDNLRVATAQQNKFNRGTRADNTSGYKGVCFHKCSRKWQAYIYKNTKQIYLGSFSTAEEAAKAYNAAAIEHHCGYARLNEVS